MDTHVTSSHNSEEKRCFPTCATTKTWINALLWRRWCIIQHVYVSLWTAGTGRSLVFFSQSESSACCLKKQLWDFWRLVRTTCCLLKETSVMFWGKPPCTQREVRVILNPCIRRKHHHMERLKQLYYLFSSKLNLPHFLKWQTKGEEYLPGRRPELSPGGMSFPSPKKRGRSRAADTT